MNSIIIDIGHAKNTGAAAAGMNEHTLCSAFALTLQERLTAAGGLHNPKFCVRLIDYATLNNKDDLNATIKEANGLKDVKLGISLHMDASENTSASGAHACYYPTSKAGLKAAVCIMEKVQSLLPGRANLTVARGNLAILKQTRAPWVLLECGFITNEHDRAFIMDPCNRKVLAQAVVDGILNYLQA